MTIEGRTLTKHFHIETRQHDFMNLDLGEGVPRRALVFGATLALVWIGSLIALFGLPSAQTSSFYLLPPALIAVFGFRDSERQPRRKALTQWAISTRYITVGHRPIIGLGARSAYRSELLPLGARWSFERVLRRVIPRLATPEWEQETTAGDAEPIQAGRAITLNQSAQVYGFDHMQKQRARHGRKVAR